MTSPNNERILALLKQERRALSAYAILDLLRGSSIRAPVQVYRALAQLQEEGAVHRVHSLNAFTACDGHHDGSRPGFLICHSCGSVEEFEDAAIDKLPQRLTRSGFEAESIALEVVGLCAECRAQ